MSEFRGHQQRQQVRGGKCFVTFFSEWQHYFKMCQDSAMVSGNHARLPPPVVLTNSVPFFCCVPGNSLTLVSAGVW